MALLVVMALVPDLGREGLAVFLLACPPLAGLQYWHEGILRGAAGARAGQVGPWARMFEAARARSAAYWRHHQWAVVGFAVGAAPLVFWLRFSLWPAGDLLRPFPILVLVVAQLYYRHYGILRGAAEIRGMDGST